MNAVAEQLTGWSLPEATGRPLGEVFHIINEETRAVVEDPVIKVLASGKVVGLANHTVLVRRDGTEIPIDDSGSPIRDRDGIVTGVVLVFHDISERKLAEEAIRASEKRFHSSLDNMIEGCQIIGRDWHYIYINEAAEKQNRRPTEELLGNRYMDMWPGVGSTNVFAMLQRCMDERIPQDMENEFTFPDGTVGWFELKISPVPEGIFILSMDITERKRTEDELIRSNTELQQFAYVASHDLQEPLRMVTAYLGLLEKKYGDQLDGDAKKYMDFAIDGGLRAKDLVRDLLEISRVDSQAKPMTRTDMNGVMDNVCNNLTVQINEEHASVTNDPLPTIMADEAQMTILLQNLVTNAIKFHGDREPKVHVSCEDKGGSMDLRRRGQRHRHRSTIQG